MLGGQMLARRGETRLGRGVIHVLATSLVLLAAPAAAQRPDARTMSCEQARSLVAARGAVVLATGQHTYDRYVASAAYCSHSELLERAWITTRGGRCNVGYTCQLRIRRQPN